MQKLANPAFDALKHFYFSIYDVDNDIAEIEVVTNDCAKYMNKLELANAVSILSTSEFSRYIDALNQRESLKMERDALMDTVLEGDTDMVIQLIDCAQQYGCIKERIKDLRDFIVNNVGDKNWYNARLVYSAMYDVNENEIS